MSWIAVAAVLSTMHYQGAVPASGGDYLDVPITIPAGAVECDVAHASLSSTYNILDWGLWAPDGSFRGWGGGNTEDAIIGVDQSSRSYLPGPIAAGTWTVVIGKAKLDPAGGTYSIDVTCSDTATLPVLAKAAYTPVTLSPDRRWYKGDFHVHSVQSGDAKATFDQITQLSTTRGLDFINMSDHNTVAQHALIAALQPSLPDFLILRGAEITTYSGHGNAVGIHDYVDHRLGYNGRDVAGISADVAAQGGIFIVNHPMLDLGDACIGCQWKHVDDTAWDQVSGMELITGNYDIGVSAFVPRVLALWDMLEDSGHRIAGIGGSDDHSAGINEGASGSEIGSPTTLVLADNLSEAAIIDAIKHGRTIVNLHGPDDPLVELTAHGKGGVTAEIGDDVSGVAEATFDVHVVGASGDFIDLMRDGEKSQHVAITSDDFKKTIADSTAGSHRYRVQLIDASNAPIVITSHIYVDALGAAAGCGCQSSNPGGSGVLALVGLLALRRRRASSARS
jgi:MYXO-CTERM domain-containing protein